jgi:hypothetical protein
MSYWHALAALIVAATLLERWFAARPTGPGSAARLRTNLGVFGLDAALAVVLAPMSAALILGFAGRPAWGGIAAIEPAWLSWLLAFCVLDLTRYLVHRLYHLPGFWRVHAPHHADTQVDWSTALRHHPLEVVIDLPIYATVLGVAGVSDTQIAALSLIILSWEVLVHANLHLPRQALWLRPAADAALTSLTRSQPAPQSGAAPSAQDQVVPMDQFGLFDEAQDDSISEATDAHDAGGSSELVVDQPARDLAAGASSRQATTSPRSNSPLTSTTPIGSRLLPSSRSAGRARVERTAPRSCR